MSASGRSRVKPEPLSKTQHIHYPFWFGGSASCFAACVTHPLDLGGFGQTFEEHMLTIVQSRYMPWIFFISHGLPGLGQIADGK